jgi:hypothetical protein
MPARMVSDEEIIAAWKRSHSPAAVARQLGLSARALYFRRARLAQKGITLPTVVAGGPGAAASIYGWQAEPTAFPETQDFTITSGCVFIGSDPHYWPGEPSLAHRAYCLLAKRLKPKLMCMNGDAFDGAGISRHEPLGWVKLPSVIEELDIVKQRLGEIERAAPNAQRFFSPGNHDTRFDRRLATEIPEMAGVPGMRMQDHIKWPMAYVAVINRQSPVPVLVMHNYRGGVHATWNNAIHAGCTIVTGHLHAQDRKAHTTYFKTAYGVDAGTMADVNHPAFSYTMGRPKNWRSGFCVMTFDEQGRHLPPELVEIQRFNDGQRAVFRGEVILED